MKDILIVSHCFLNTAAKVKRFKEQAVAEEEDLRRELLKLAADRGIQLIQLPCPEFVMYGPVRWGHTCEQFDNTFYRNRCRELLAPVMLEIKEYLSHPEEFRILGVLGIDGSPSCGVKYTCRGEWGGEFSGRDIAPVIRTVHLEEGRGVFMEVLDEMLRENGVELPVEGLFARERERAFRLLGTEM